MKLPLSALNDALHMLNRVNLRQFLKIFYCATTVFDWRLHAQYQNSYIKKLISYFNFFMNGIFTGEKVHIYFDSKEYRNSYPKSLAKTRYPFLHYLARGSGKNPLIDFDHKYLTLNPDVIEFGNSLLYHYVKLGARENREIAEYMPESNSVTELLIQMPSAFSSPISERISVHLNVEHTGFLQLSDSDELIFLRSIQIHTTESNLGTDFLFVDDVEIQVSCTGSNIAINIVSATPVFLDLKWLRRLILQFDIKQPTSLNGFIASLRFLLSSISKRLPTRFEITGGNFSFSSSQYASVPADFSLVRFKFKEIVVRQFEVDDPYVYTILLVSHEDSQTGAPLYLLQLARYLEHQGVKVIILSVRPEYRSGVFSDAGFETIYVADLSLESSFDALWILNSDGKAAVRDFLQKLSPNQVWVNSINASCIVEIATLLGIPTALFVHESFGFRGEGDSFFNVYDKLFCKALESANLVIFGSEFSQKAFELPDLFVHSAVVLSLKDDTTLTPMTERGIGIESRINLRIPTDARVYLSMATFEERKRIQDIISAFKQAKIENAILVLVGYTESDDYNSYIRRLVRDDERIQLYPVTPHPEIYYEIADVLILASESETYPLVLQDAIHWNLLRVVSQFPGYTTSCNEDNALLFQVGDVKSLSRLLAQTALSTEGFNKLLENAKSDFIEKRELYLERILRLQSDLSGINVTIARNL
jgi:glycosyltransferase involved in cell wall biosynthesis